MLQDVIGEVARKLSCFWTFALLWASGDPAIGSRSGKSKLVSCAAVARREHRCIGWWQRAVKVVHNRIVAARVPAPVSSEVIDNA